MNVIAKKARISLFLIKNIILINNDLEIHKQVKTNEIKFQRFGVFMTPLSRNGLMNTVRVKKSSGQINLHKRS